MRKTLSILLIPLLLGVVVSPVQATTYKVTVTLSKQGTTLFQASFSLASDTGIVEVKVPQKLHDLIVQAIGSDTLVTPFSVEILGLTLTVDSDPAGLTVKFVPLPLGDVNGDGHVSIIDAAMLGWAYGSKPGASNYIPNADIDISGSVNIVDAAILGYNYGM